MALKKGSRRLRALIKKKAILGNRLPVKWPQECRRCGYKWKSRRKRPTFCSRCKTKAWDKAISEAPPRRKRRRYWLKPGSQGKMGHKLPKGRMVVRVPGRRGYMSERLARKRRRDAEVKRAKRKAARGQAARGDAA